MQFKKILFLYTLTNLFLSTTNFARENFLCSLFFANDVAEKVQMLEYDKAKHCSVTCMLTKRCGAIDALELGTLKEIHDLFGPGEADLRDINANIQGAKFALMPSTRNDKHCLDLCSTTFFKSEEK